MTFSVAFILAFCIICIVMNWSNVSKDKKLSTANKLWKIASIMFAICTVLTIAIIFVATTFTPKGELSAFQGLGVFGSIMEICIAMGYIAIYMFIIVPIHLVRKFMISEE